MFATRPLKAAAPVLPAELLLSVGATFDAKDVSVLRGETLPIYLHAEAQDASSQKAMCDCFSRRFVVRAGLDSEEGVCLEQVECPVEQLVHRPAPLGPDEERFGREGE